MHPSMETPTDTTNEYFIEKIRMPVALTLLGGHRVSGELFIQASARHLSALEDGPEFMNAPEAFFPLRLPAGDTLLVAKTHVMSVIVPREFASHGSLEFGELTRVEVEMAGGAMHEGQLLVENFVSGARVLDHLNHNSERFLSLFREDGVWLLNRSHIATVRPLDDAAA
jgi:hypothetical protein